MLTSSDAWNHTENALYNLIVSTQPWGSRTGRMVAGRVFEYTSAALAQRFRPNGDLAIDHLRQTASLKAQRQQRIVTGP